MTIKIFDNPIDEKSVLEYQYSGSLIDFLQTEFPDGFGVPSVHCFVNGNKIEPKHWDIPVSESDDIVFLMTPALTGIMAAFSAVSGWLASGTILANAAISMAVSAGIAGIQSIFSSKPHFGQSGVAHQQFSLYNTESQTKLGASIPVVYGSIVQAPDFASKAYQAYDTIVCDPSGSTTIGQTEWNRSAGDKYEFGLYVLGQGTHEIESYEGKSGSDLVQLLGANFIKKDYIVPEAGQPYGVLNADFNVGISNGPKFDGAIVSETISSDVILKDKGKVGPYHLEWSTINRVEVDIDFPQGLNIQDNRANFRQIDVTIQITATEKASGAKVIQNVTFSQGSNNIDALRRTIQFDVPPGQYSIEIERMSAKYTGNDHAQDSMKLGAIKGRRVVDPTLMLYKGCHILAARFQSGDKVPPGVFRELNVRYHRMLPSLEDGSLKRTSNPADVIFDIITNKLYGAGRPTEEIDMVRLRSLRVLWGGDNSLYGVNGQFSSKQPVWNALNQALENCAGAAGVRDGQLTVITDGKRSVRTQVFSEANITPEGFNFSVTWPKVGEPDGYRVSYRNPQSNEIEHVQWPIGAYNPKSIELHGCTDKTVAAQFARLQFQREQYGNVTVQLETEREGRVAVVGDLVGVSHTLTKWGVSGNMVDFDYGTSIVTMDVDTINATHDRCILRDAWGVPTAELRIEPLTTSTFRMLDPVPIELHMVHKINSGDPTHIIVGSFGDIMQDYIVQSVAPQGDKTVLQLRRYDERVFEGGYPWMQTSFDD